MDSGLQEVIAAWPALPERRSGSANLLLATGVYTYGNVGAATGDSANEGTVMTTVTPDSAFMDVNRFGSVLEEFASGDDRTAAILGASLVDDSLEQALRFYLRHNEQGVQRLFEEGEPALGTLSAKIDLCAALGIIGPVTYKDLGRVRKVRNLFAHKMLMKSKGPALEKASFGIQQIADLCNALVFVSQHMDLTRFGTGPRSRYMQTCVTVAMLLFGYVNASQGKEKLMASLP